MKIVDVLNNPSMINPHGVRVSKVYDGESAIAVHMTLEPGDQVQPHAAPVDVFFYVLEGEVNVTIEDETQLVTANHLVESSKMIPHGLRNGSDKPARVLVVKTDKV